MFYQSALKRERALIENAAHKAEETEDSTIGLLVGGFHSKHLAKALKELGFSLIVISPRFTPVDAQETSRKYFEILEYSAKNLPKEISL